MITTPVLGQLIPFGQTFLVGFKAKPNLSGPSINFIDSARFLSALPINISIPII